MNPGGGIRNLVSPPGGMTQKPRFQVGSKNAP